MMKYCAGLLGPTSYAPGQVHPRQLPTKPALLPHSCPPYACIFATYRCSRQLPPSAFSTLPASVRAAQPPCISDVTALSQSTTADRNRAIQLACYTAVLMRIDDARVAYAYTCTCISEVVWALTYVREVMAGLRTTWIFLVAIFIVISALYSALCTTRAW